MLLKYWDNLTCCCVRKETNHTMPELDCQTGDENERCSVRSRRGVQCAVALLAAACCCVILLTNGELGQHRNSDVHIKSEVLSPQFSGTDITREELLASRTGDSDAFRISAEHLPRRHHKEQATSNHKDSSNQPEPEEEMHIVMLGDSVMRYQYLDLIYRLHSCSSNISSSSSSTKDRNNTGNTLSAPECPQPPNRLLLNKETLVAFKPAKANSKLQWLSNYMSYYRYSVSLFNGSMACDCSRPPIPDWIPSAIETRSYRHPTRMLRVSYVQVFGEQKLLTRAQLNRLDPMTSLPINAKIAVMDKKRDNFYFKNISLLRFAEEYAPMMQPKPTHFVMNIGIWRFSNAFASQGMPSVVRALRRVAKHVVWRETSQPSPHAFTPMLTFQTWKAKQHRIQRIDALMYRRLCKKPSSPSSPSTTMTTSNGTLLLQPPLCHYFSIPPLPGVPRNALNPPNTLGDRRHPHPFQYKFWNAKLWRLLLSLDH